MKQETDKTKTTSKNQKQTCETGRKEERKEQERDNKRESEKGGGQKKAKEKQRETQKIRQKCPSSGGNMVFSIKSKERKAKKKHNKKTEKEDKAGLGPSEVALWATSPDP